MLSMCSRRWKSDFFPRTVRLCGAPLRRPLALPAHRRASPTDRTPVLLPPSLLPPSSAPAAAMSQYTCAYWRLQGM